jgi:predicted nucleotidyltransferase
MAMAAQPSKQTLITSLKGLEGPLRERGVTSLHVFGSRARGDADTGSDVDVLVGVEEKGRFSLIDLAHIAVLASEQTGLEVNPVIAADLQPPFMRRIRPDLVRVF